jgi:hypothetical protein
VLATRPISPVREKTCIHLQLVMQLVTAASTEQINSSKSSARDVQQVHMREACGTHLGVVMPTQVATTFLSPRTGSREEHSVLAASA